MGRLKSKMRVRLVNRKDSPCWYISYDGEDGKQKQRNTHKRKSDYTQEMMLKIINNKIGTKESAVLSVLWFRDHTLQKFEDGRENTLLNNRVAFKHLRKHFGDNFSITNIDREAIIGFEDYLMKTGLSNASINHYFQMYSAAMQELYREDRVSNNPFRRYHKHLKEDKPKKKSLKKDEAKAFLKVVFDTKGNEDLKRLVRILFFMGMRTSELFEIERTDIDLEKMKIEVMNVKDRYQEKRENDIPETVWTDFRYFLQKYPNKEKPFNCCSKVYFSSWVKERFVRAGFPTLHAHNLRHSFVSIRAKEGADIRALSRYIGHKSVLTTENIYASDMHQSIPALEL
ncbi:tyrosine-type recombinase/integrase [Candidatus Latescibacterota bacterium]